MHELTIEADRVASVSFHIYQTLDDRVVTFADKLAVEIAFILILKVAVSIHKIVFTTLYQQQPSFLNAAVDGGYQPVHLPVKLLAHMSLPFSSRAMMTVAGV